MTMSVFDQSFSQRSNCLGLRAEVTGSKKELLAQRQKASKMSSEHLQKKQEIDTLLSQAFNEMTFEERQESQEVLHGVGKEIAEESIFIENALKDLDQHLTLIKCGSSYEKAERMNPDYVTDRSFRIMFLRGNRYDTKSSADQMLRFFAQKEKLFGTEKLVKDITLGDLNEDDMVALKSGSIQLAGRDRANRQIFFQVPGLRDSEHYLTSELRMRYYITMCALESQETQIKGGVSIAYAVGEYKDKSEGKGFLEHTNLATVRNFASAAVFGSCNDSIPPYTMCFSPVFAYPLGELSLQLFRHSTVSLWLCRHDSRAIEASSPLSNASWIPPGMFVSLVHLRDLGTTTAYMFKHQQSHLGFAQALGPITLVHGSCREQSKICRSWSSNYFLAKHKRCLVYWRQEEQ